MFKGSVPLHHKVLEANGLLFMPHGADAVRALQWGSEMFLDTGSNVEPKGKRNRLAGRG